MELSKQDRVVMSVIKMIQEMGLTVVSTATELGTEAIHIRGKRGDGVKIIVIVDSHGRAYYDT
jgi:acyl-CoA synthetase (AMP-forming)/AMP-acid ligase II